MPIVHRKSNDFETFAVWESSEDLYFLATLARLTESEMAFFDTFKSVTRKREFLTVRALLRELLPENVDSISYDENGKPHLNSQGSISISHTGHFVALMVSQKTRCGIDIETVSERILKLGKKFVNETEKETLPERSLMEHLQVIWGAKEVMFKIHSLGDLDFKKHLHTEAFQYYPSGISNRI
ncbi:MAG: 4'-phosphopantetheinyl transferase superfamily protein [Bacteroidetes bacterium]|nr:4'-phosphopantetheinyl transferase superfamily protein [Bacteroidota bacterium]